MKIQSIGTYSGTKPLNISLNKGYNLATTDKVAGDSFVATKPIAAQNVSFTSSYSKLFDTLDLLPCPYTGLPMISHKKWCRIDTDKFSGPAISAVKSLRKYQKYLHPTERKVFDILDVLARKNPQKNVKELLTEIRPEFLQRLKNVEKSVFKEIIKEGKKLPYFARKRFEKFMNFELDIIDNTDGFKRKRVLYEVQKMHDTSWFNKKQYAAILKKAEKLPTSRDDEFAFIVKYTQKNPTTGDDTNRKPMDICLRLLNSSRGTIEHIKPQALKGKDELYNYLRASATANSRRGCTPLSEFIEQNPAVVNNITNHMKGVIAFANKGRLGKYWDYPEKIAKTLFEESKGKIKIDLSDYKPQRSKI